MISNASTKEERGNYFSLKTMTKYTSEIYTVNATQAQAYERLADLRRFEALKAAFSDPEKMQYILQNLPADQVSPEKLAEIREQVEKMQFTEDTISADTKVGPVSLAIVEREPCKLVKLVTQNSPVNATVWVQLVEKGTYQAALKVTIGVELNFFIRKMVEKHIKKGARWFGTVLEPNPTRWAKRSIAGDEEFSVSCAKMANNDSFIS